MDLAQTLYGHLRQKEPFCFSKFNDGEWSLLAPNTTASRGHQKTSDLLRVKLFEALIHTHPRYYLGLPCPNCNSAAHTGAATLRCGTPRAPADHPLANALINCNVGETVRTLKEVLPSYPSVHIVVSHQADVSALQKELGVTFASTLRVPANNAFDPAYRVLAPSRFENGACVLLCCGPLGRVLAHEWFLSHEHNITCLELGSLFDPITQNKAYMYHYGGLGPCPHCNPRPDHDGAFTSYLTASTQSEHWFMPLRRIIEEYRVPSRCMAAYLGKKGREYERRLCLALGAQGEERERLLREVHTDFPDRWEAGTYLFDMRREWRVLQDLMTRQEGPKSELTDHEVYSWRVYAFAAVEAWYNGRLDLGLKACERLLEPERSVPEEQRDMAMRNISYYR